MQRELLSRYHVKDAQTFLSGSEVWQVPDDPTNKSGDAVPPYYLSMKMPDQQAQAFSLTTTFTPTAGTTSARSWPSTPRRAPRTTGRSGS